MIDKNENSVEWALLNYELTDARDHIEELLRQMESDDFNEIEYAIRLGHIQAHLNWAWHMRNLKRSMTDAEFELFSQYPTDLVPNGTGLEHLK